MQLPGKTLTPGERFVRHEQDRGDHYTLRMTDPEPPMDGADKPKWKVSWAHKATVPRSFPLRRFLVSYALAFLPPITRWKVLFWALFPGIPALGWLVTWYIDRQITGAGDAVNEVRWAANISLGLVFLVGLFSPSANSEDRDHRSDPFRRGAVEQAVIVGPAYAVKRGDGWISVRMRTIRRVRYLLGVAALQLPSGAYWIVPGELFLSRDNWAKVVEARARRAAMATETLPT